jgi:hypothetical protein
MMMMTTAGVIVVMELPSPINSIAGQTSLQQQQRQQYVFAQEKK